MLKLVVLIIIMRIIAWDTVRIFKAFLQFVERKFLVIQLIKLITVFIIIYRFPLLSPLNWILGVFLLTLIISFLSMLSLRQTELTIKKFNKYRTFKYNKFSELGLRVFASITNFREIITNKDKAKNYLKESLFLSIFPVQKFFAVSLTGIEFTNRKDKFITNEQLQDIKSKLSPGDILLKRNDWQATNIGIPGFWTHSGMYIGNLEEIDNYFKDTEELSGKKFSEFLKEINESLYNLMASNSDLNIIEAIEEGVSLKPLGNIAKVDYFSALRPKAEKVQKLNAIKTAFGLIGKPYGYHFDIHSENEFMCTGLIKKAYEDVVALPIVKKLGKPIILPNDVAKKFTKEHLKSYRQLDFVLFYDLDIYTRKAFENTEDQFLETYRRNIFFYKKREMLKYLSTAVTMPRL